MGSAFCEERITGLSSSCWQPSVYSNPQILSSCVHSQVSGFALNQEMLYYLIQKKHLCSITRLSSLFRPRLKMFISFFGCALIRNCTFYPLAEIPYIGTSSAGRRRTKSVNKNSGHNSAKRVMEHTTVASCSDDDRCMRRRHLCRMEGGKRSFWKLRRLLRNGTRWHDR